MRVEPIRVFFAIAAIDLLALIWVNQPWLAMSFFYAALAGWLWNLIPVWFQAPLPKLNELFPVIMLLLFMLVLGGAPMRTTSEALFYTAAALVLFRGIVYLLLRIRNSKQPVPRIVKYALVALLFEAVLNGIHVYSTFRPVSDSTQMIVRSLSARVMMLILMVGCLQDQSYSRRERAMAGLFALSIFGNFYFSGGILILNAVLFLKERGFQYENDVD